MASGPSSSSASSSPAPWGRGPTSWSCCWSTPPLACTDRWMSRSYPPRHCSEQQWEHLHHKRDPKPAWLTIHKPLTCFGSNELICFVDQVKENLRVIRSCQVHPLGDLQLWHCMDDTSFIKDFYGSDEHTDEFTYHHCVPLEVSALVGSLLVLQLDVIPKVQDLLLRIWPVLAFNQHSNHNNHMNLITVPSLL